MESAFIFAYGFIQTPEYFDKYAKEYMSPGKKITNLSALYESYKFYLFEVIPSETESVKLLCCTRYALVPENFQVQKIGNILEYTWEEYMRISCIASHIPFNSAYVATMDKRMLDLYNSTMSEICENTHYTPADFILARVVVPQEKCPLIHVQCCVNRNNISAYAETYEHARDTD